MKIERMLGWGLVAGLPVLLASAGTGAQSRHHGSSRTTCAEGQHASGGHCCGAGEAWVEERSRCVCLEAGRCQGAATPNASPCAEGTVLINGGFFSMGSAPNEGEANERPLHRVTLPDFCMDRTEVTVAAYRTCVEAHECTPPADQVLLQGIPPAEVQFWSRFCNGLRPERNQHPVNCVDWVQADTYCQWRGGRLPTEAEWEYSARGSEGRRYPWGNTPPGPALLNACGSECRDMGAQRGRANWPVLFNCADAWEGTSPVGSYPSGASSFGVLDLAGNVWEWTADLFGPYAPGDATNPAGATTGGTRVVRSSSWYAATPDAVRAADRGQRTPTDRLSTLGFRCAQARGL